MDKTITIPLETYKCLREHLDKANQIFASLGKVEGLASERKNPQPKPKETKAQQIQNCKKLIGNGQRPRKPEYLKK